MTYGRKSVDVDHRFDKPPTSIINETIRKIRNLVCSDCRLTIREMAEEFNLSFYATQSIFTEDLNVYEIFVRRAERIFKCLIN